ncbi:MAG: hypothetical protein NC308_01020 [Clostridium sp.]|nr:hypothetical protein [Bacteroides sp.]MCM1197446.1 hypothetical protein [Clostridium sp.]
MKRIFLLLSVSLIVCGCIGKIKSMGFSKSEIVFSDEASSDIVYSDVPAALDVLKEDDTPDYGFPSEENRTHVEGNWVTVTIANENQISVQVSENVSGQTRTAVVSFRGRQNPNYIDSIHIIQTAEYGD